MINDTPTLVIQLVLLAALILGPWLHRMGKS
jgi:hypothetical protein